MSKKGISDGISDVDHVRLVGHLFDHYRVPRILQTVSHEGR